MNHVFTTIIASVAPHRIAGLRADIEVLGNPADAPMASALDAIGRIHFASLNVFPASTGDRGHLVFEFSGDGPRDGLLDLLADKLGPFLTPIFDAAADRGAASLAAFWKAHIVTTGQSLFANPGVDFSGTPGLSVVRIKRERELTAHLTTLLPGGLLPGTSALAALDRLRSTLRSDPAWSWAVEPEPVVDTGITVDLPTGLAGAVPVVIRFVPAFIKAFLWPLALPVALFFAFAWWLEGCTWKGGLLALGWTLPATLAIVLATAGQLYFTLRRREEAEVPVDRPPAPDAVAAIMQRENFAAQNHLAGISVMKGGRLRRLTLRLAFWATSQLASNFYRPGFLGSLGTIHFARWVTVPGTNDLLFLSNYGGSWESYLEDFITKAHTGLTGVWSNTLDFPKTSNLFGAGATDGERFKRWARRQQIPTAFWYSAYPDITTANIRTNVAIRQGLGAALTESEAQRWLALFGSEIRPADELESDQIQSLALGGLGFLHHGEALLFELSGDLGNAKIWLRELLPSVSFSDGRSLDNAIILGLAHPALSKLDLPQESIASFPPAFVDGMTAPWRSRALGDVGDNAPDTWWWGGDSGRPIDGVLLLYAKTPQALASLHASTVNLLARHGHCALRAVPFRPLADKAASQEEAFTAKCEPFGFVDGISQPVIRGSYKALRGVDAIHLVEPGEFILGYPDNRGQVPPSPVIAAINDPANLLPTAADSTSAVFSTTSVNADHDLGRNGSFLAIRQLEQNVNAFWNFCQAEGERLKAYFPPGVHGRAEEYIAAKLVGRWRDGSPLTRYPRYPASAAPLPAHTLARATSAGSTHQQATTLPIPPSPTIAKAAAASHTEAASRRTDDSDSMRGKPKPPFEPDNDFLFGSEDPQGLRCPLGAHIRRANPRESFDPRSTQQLDITNRHRIIRVGRFYEPLENQKQGLFFMCLNGDLARQFEFVQQTWLQSSSFHGLANERDPLTGGRSARAAYTIPTRGGPLRVENLTSFVHTRGGGYFFLPGRRTLQYLGS